MSLNRSEEETDAPTKQALVRYAIRKLEQAASALASANNADVRDWMQTDDSNQELVNLDRAFERVSHLYHLITGTVADNQLAQDLEELDDEQAGGQQGENQPN